MAFALTTLLQLQKPENAASNNTWGLELNVTIELIDDVFADRGGNLTTTGSSSAYAVTAPNATTYTLLNGLFFRAKANHANTGASTMAYNGLTTKAIRKLEGGADVALVAGDYPSGHMGEFAYSTTANSGAGAYLLLNPAIASLAQGGTGKAFTAPGADRIPFYDFSALSMDWLTASTGLVISGTTLTADIGTSGAKLPVLNAANTWSAAQVNSAQPSFLARKTTDSNNATGDGTLFTVVFNSERADRGSGYDNSTGVFTAPVTGLYQLQAMVGLEDVAVGHTAFSIQIVTSNQSYNVAPGDLQPDANLKAALQIQTLADMEAGDTAYVVVAAYGSTAAIDVPGTVSGSETSFFSGFLVA